MINLTQLNGDKDDKFRIQLYEHGLSKLLGKKDIAAVLLQSEKGESSHTKVGRNSASCYFLDL